MNKLEPREGDVLVVSYPESTISLGGTSYSAVKVGGLIYTRKLLAKDDLDAQYDLIYDFLKQRAQRDGRMKVDEFQAELRRVRGK